MLTPELQSALIFADIEVTQLTDCSQIMSAKVGQGCFPCQRYKQRGQRAAQQTSLSVGKLLDSLTLSTIRDFG